MLGRTDSRTRMVLIMLAFAMVAAAASVRLGQWQIVEAGELTAQYLAAIELAQVANESIRADIIDRDGVVLAKTSSFDKLVAYPDRIDPEDDEAIVAVLAALLDLKPRERERYLRTFAEAHANDSKFLVLESRITLKQSEAILDAIEEKALPGIGLDPQQVRHYPRKGGEPGTSLASHVIGFVRADGRGGEGVERYYDERLMTADPALVDLATASGSAISFEGVDPPAMQLTIDAKLQKQVEQELYQAREANRAKSASAIVMDPKTGAILAAASVPAYDAEDYATIASRDISLLRNRVFSDQYEPGSVMKIFTVTAALDLGVVTPHTPITDEKVLEFWKYKVRNADHKTVGTKSVKDIIALSRNVATAKIARKLAPNPRAANATQKAGHRLYDLWKKVGLVGRTGVDISSEATGKAFDPDEKLWAPVELANRAFGQGAAFTLPQLARGMSTLVNGGYLVQPHLVADGAQATVKPERVLRAKTARQAKDILRHVTGSVYYYAKGSLIPGYDVGGKTGTAQIWDSELGDWKPTRWNHSFIGFIGGRKQEYVIAVRLEEPVPSGKVSQGSIPLQIQPFELYQMVARATIEQLNMRKSKDPNAGLPIIGTDAAARLTPIRNQAAKQQAKQVTERTTQKATKKTTTKAKAKRTEDGFKVAAEPEAAAQPESRSQPKPGSQSESKSQSKSGTSGGGDG